MMLNKKPVGRYGSARKYDLLTALGAHGLASGKTEQRLSFRLICLITARYNWQHDELSVGQVEIARLWAVDPRTVKREMATLRKRGWLIERRPAARGRVAVHGLGFERILLDTRAHWPNVGSDFVSRLGEAGPAEPAPAPDANVIRFPKPREGEDTLWGRAQSLLHAMSPASYAAWLAPLRFEGADEGEAMLLAPSAFHASYVSIHFTQQILQALRHVDPEISSAQIVPQR